MQREVHYNEHRDALLSKFCPRGTVPPQILLFWGQEPYLLRISGEVGNGEGGEDHEQRVVVEQAVFPQLLEIGEIRVLKAGSMQGHKTSSPMGDTHLVPASLVPPPQVSPVQHGQGPAYLGIQLLLDVGTVRSC